MQLPRSGLCCPKLHAGRKGRIHRIETRNTTGCGGCARVDATYWRANPLSLLNTSVTKSLLPWNMTQAVDAFRTCESALQYQVWHGMSACLQAHSGLA